MILDVVALTHCGCDTLGTGRAPHLLGVELLPLAVVEALHEGHHMLWSEQVDEGVAHIALVLETGHTDMTFSSRVYFSL